MKGLIQCCILITLFLQTTAQGKKTLTLENAIDRQLFAAQSITGIHPMNDGLHYSVMTGGTSITRYSFKTGESAGEVFDLKKAVGLPIQSFSDYEFSPDETRILLTTDVRRIYRHSFTAGYYIWNRVTEELTPLSSKGPQQAVTFSHDGEKVAFVRANNLFIKNLKFGTESQVTFNGEKNKVINGLHDWVNEEEFNESKAFAWSPDHKFLAYIRYDETDVPAFSMNKFRGSAPELPENSVYPGYETFKYPKAGEKNAVITVHIYDLKSRTTLKADLGEEKDIYVPRLTFTPDGSNLVVMRLNRRQNQLNLLYVNPNTGDSRVLLSETNKRFIDENFLDHFTFLPDGKFIVVSERTGWFQMFIYDKQGFEVGRIAPGDYDVTKFYGYDPIKKSYFYQAALESPLRREVCFISADGKKKGKLSGREGTNDAVFSRNFTHFINTFTSSEQPALVTLHDITGKLIKNLEENQSLVSKLNEYDLPKREFFTFTTSENVQLNGWMLKPSFFNDSKKYPVIMTQYSGPNSQRVVDAWGGIRWNEYLAQQGFIVVCADPRGTGARGEEFRKITYMQLGKYESDDQVEAAKYIATLPYVDNSKISIFGWSFGGFISLMSMGKGGNLFKAGIAVAPVTSHRFYDTAYTERYMRTPSENATGYDENSPLAHADKIKGRLLIIHGTADDNVHIQNTYEFTEKLVQSGVQFDMAVYTNRNHNITGGNTTLHLYTRMTDFLRENLLK